MKIFILIPWFRPAFKAGGPIQSIANMVEQFAVGIGQLAVGSRESLVGSRPTGLCEELGVVSQESVARSRELAHVASEAAGENQFSIFTSNKDLDGTILTSVPHDQWVQYNSNARVWYSSDDKIISVLKKEISVIKPDLFYVVGLYDWEYNFKPLYHFRGVEKIISVRGMLHPGALSEKGFKKKVYLGVWRLLGWHRRYRFHVSDEKEKGYVKGVFGEGVRVAVAGNFPVERGKMVLPMKKVGELKMVSVALVSPMKNILLVLESLVESREGTEVEERRERSKKEDRNTKVTKEHEGHEEENASLGMPSGLLSFHSLEYNIYGPVKDKGYWESCLEVMKRMPANVRVKYHGEIPPAEIGKVLGAHHVFILPSKSENYGHAIIEALSAGLPVITSYATPWNGLEEAKAGVNVSTDDLIDLMNAVDNFVGMEDGEFKEWSEGAACYARKMVDVGRTRRGYEEMFGGGK